MARTWVNGGPPALNATNLNALEADITAKLDATAAATTYVAKVDAITLPTTPPSASGQALTATSTTSPYGLAWVTPAGGSSSGVDAASLYNGTTAGVAKLPWGGEPAISPELWALAQFDAGGSNTTSLTPTITGNNAAQTLTTRIRVGNVSADGQVQETYRLLYTVTASLSGFNEPSVLIRGVTAGGTLVDGTDYLLWNQTATPNGGFSSMFEWTVPALAASGVRYLEVVLSANAASGSLGLTGVSLKQVPRGRPALLLSSSASGAFNNTSGNVYVDLPIHDPVTGTLTRARQTFNTDGALTYSPIDLNTYRTDLAPTTTAYSTDTGYGRVRTSGGGVTMESNIFAPPGRLVHGQNDGQVLGVILTAGTVELRGNVHGGETGRTGANDFLFEFDRGDGTWLPLADGGYTHAARRVRFTSRTKITRSDQSTPFANVDYVHTLYDDGTIRYDRTVTFLAAQQMSNWFYFMHSFDNAYLTPGRIGAGTQTIASFDSRQRLATPVAPTAASSATGGTYGTATRVYSVTAITTAGESLASPTVSVSTASGTTNSFTVTLPTAATGQTAWGVYDATGLLAVVPVSRTTYVDTTPTYGTRSAPVRNTAAVLPGTQQYSRAMSGTADWAAVYDENYHQLVYATVADRDNAATYPGSPNLTCELDSHPGVVKNYWQLQSVTGNLPAGTALQNSPYPQLVPSGTVISTTAYSFMYAPRDRTHWHDEAARKAQQIKQLATLYPAPAGTLAVPDTTPPTAPSSLAAGTPTSSTIPLTWTAATDNIAVTGYTAYNNGTQIATGLTGTSGTLTGLTASTAYVLTLKAYDAAGNLSAASNTVNVSTAAAAGAVSFTDTFNRTNGALGNGWSLAGSNVVTIVSNAATGTNAFQTGFAYRDLLSANGTVAVAIPAASGWQNGVLFRWTDANNYWAIYDTRLHKVAAGVDTVMAGYSASNPQSISVVLSGSSINVTIDGSAQSVVTDSFNSTATNHGLFVFHTVTPIDTFTYTP